MSSTTGLALKLERTAKRVKATELAQKMGVKRQRISTIESLAVVSDDAASRYRDALMSLTTAAEEAVA